jgi:hypothetical protein
MARKPIGDEPMSAAERQQRRRAAATHRAADPQIETLAATVAALEQRVAVLESRPAVQAPRAPRPVEPELRIEFLGTGQRWVVEIPPDDELQRLRATVDAAYPELAFRPRGERWADADAAADFHAFKIAFEYLATLSRIDALQTRYATSWWVSGAEGWARDIGRSAMITRAPFIAALLAHGDIRYSRLDEPHSVAFGLAEGAAGRRYDPASWRRVLAGGGLLAPVPLPSNRTPAAPSPSRVFAAG